MILSSRLPLGSIYLKHWHTDDTEIGIVVAKALFEIRDGGVLKTIKPAPDLVLADVFAGDDIATAPLKHEQDIAPCKVATDLTVNAMAHSPGGKPAQEWPVAVSIPEKLHYEARVRGPSRWSKSLTGWVRDQPGAVTEVPLSYSHAYGGPERGTDDADAPNIYQLNPAGMGRATKDSLSGEDSFDAHQVGLMGDFMAIDPTIEATVAGFGPIAKAWLPRRAYAGTFDEEWEQTRHPKMPDDYDYRFWNAAPHPLQIEPMLLGNETIHLDGMTPGGDRRSITLPGVKLKLAATGDNVSKSHTMKLDTVHIDIADADPAAHRVTVLWRAMITGPDRFTTGELVSAKVED